MRPGLRGGHRQHGWRAHSASPTALLQRFVATATNTPLPAAQPEHDMEQVARLVYAALARDWNTLPAHAPAAQLLEWWRVRDELNPLATLLQLAREACSGEEAAREAFKDGIRRTLL